MVYACRVLDDSLVVDNRWAHCAAVNLGLQTSYVADILLCASIVDKFVNLCMDDVVRIDDMLALVMLLHVTQSHNS